MFFLAGEASQVVRGERWARLVPAIDGRRDAGEIADTAGVPVFEVEHGLETLAARELLVADGARAGATASGAATSPSPSTRTARVGEQLGAPFSVVALGGVEAEALAEALAAAGVADARASRALVLVEDYLSPALAAWDEEARASARTWLPASVVADYLWLGPLCGPAAPACCACLVTDLARSLPVLALWHRLPGAAMCSPAPARQAPLVADRIVAALSDPAAPWREHLLTIEVESGRARPHATRRYRACPVCGETGAQPPALAPVLLASRAVVSSAGGGWRCAPPALIRERLAPFLSPLTGWVRDLERLPLPPGLATHVAVATYPYPVQLQCFEDLRGRPQIAAAGKGLTPAQAEVGALAEAIERVCGVFRGDEPRRIAKQEDLGEEAIDPNSVQLFSASQLAAVERDGDGRHAPAATFDPAEPLEWTALWSLSAERERFLPTTLCYHAYRGAGPCCPADSNGCAAGANREEAILQGLLELLERDCVAIWWYHRLPRPPFGVSSRLARKLDSARAAHARVGRELALLDLTADLGVPVAAAVSRSIAYGDLRLGFGAHLDPDLAAGRALAELHQFWPDEGGQRGGQEARGVVARRGWDAQPWLRVRPSAPRASRFGTASGNDLRVAIEDLVARLGERGIEVLVLDQTRDGSPLAVVRVVAPGLRPWWRRLAPGRLYDVPVELGWLAAAPAEDDLNPRPLEV